ncbi:MAG: hypothetical protein AB2689_09810 [Candidatus Thiodiazotropha taylori]
MMTCNYTAKSGEFVEFDLDAVFDLVGGNSKIRNSWSALIIFIPNTETFIELRSSPQDVRGNSDDEAEEVDEKYIQNTFDLSLKQIGEFRKCPQKWRFIDKR